MWEKFKESNFAKKCKELFRRRGVVAVTLCLVLALAVVLSVSVATNRAKKKYAIETDGNVSNQTESPNEKTNEEADGTVNLPTHNAESEAPVGAEPEIFTLSLPTEGAVAKGHDATIQVCEDGTKAGPVSTVATLSVANAIVLEACEIMNAHGVQPKVFRSGNCPGTDDYNAIMLEQYGHRIRHL